MKIQMAELWKLKLLACKKASMDDECLPMINPTPTPTENAVLVTFTMKVTGEEVEAFAMGNKGVINE